MEELIPTFEVKELQRLTQEVKYYNQQRDEEQIVNTLNKVKTLTDFILNNLIS
jgi:hypothetical protein